MLKLLSFFLLLLLTVACTLSAEQENKLNKQLSKYIKSYNSSNTLEYAGLTHPAVVRYYTSQGDSSFIRHFNNEATENKVTLDNPLFREMRSEGDWIERKYTISRDSSDESSNSYEIFAISSDAGDNWFFMTQDDYFLKKIPLKKRLFSN